MAGFGASPGNTAASMTFRGAGANNDLFYIDALQVYPITRPAEVSHWPGQGEHIEKFTPVTFSIQDGLKDNIPVTPDSIHLFLNNSLVPPNLVAKSGDITTIQYLPAGGWIPDSSNTCRLEFNDTQSPPRSFTNEFTFIVLPMLESTFILGWYHAANGESTAFDEMAAHGFNTIMDYELGMLAENGQGALVQDQITGAIARGIRVQFELSNDLLLSTSGNNWSRLDAQVNQFKNYPLASWQMSDEPEYSIPTDVFQAAVQRIRLLDTNHPISAVFTTDNARYQPYLPSVQIAAVDNYPYVNGNPNPNLRSYTKSAQKLVQLASGSGARPLFVVQAFDPTIDNEFSNYVQPTSEQQRFLTYAPLTVGIKGLMYWTFYRNSPQTRAAKVYPVTDHLVRFIPVLTSTNPPPTVSSSGDASSLGDGIPDLSYLVRQHRGSTYVIAANNLSVTAPVTLTLQGQWPTNTIVNVLTERRAISPQFNVPGNLTFNDSFGPYKIHLYEVISAPAPVQVGYWRFEEFSGPVLFDSVPAPADDGILLGGARRAEAAPNTTVPQTEAENRRSIEFSGIDGDAVDSDAGPLLDVGSGEFTLEGWLNARTIPGGFAMIAGKRISGLFGDNGYELIAQSVGARNFTVYFSIRAGGPQLTLTSSPLTLGNWYHVAAVRSSNPSRLSLYLDGVLVQTMDDTLAGSNLNSTQHLTIGGGIEGDGAFHRPFDGFIDEVRLTKAALLPSAFLNSQPARPVLSFARMGSQMSLSWAGVGFTLQATTNQISAGGWMDLPIQTNPAVVPIVSGNQFFRLIVQ
jgi:hypothetical protein